MNYFDSFPVILNEYVKKYPNEIHVFASVHEGNCLFPTTVPYYRFHFSKQSEERTRSLLKKDIPNTEALYKKIKEEFLTEKQLLVVEYKTKTIKNEYSGIQLENSKNQKLNIYFPQKMEMAYNQEIDYWNQIRANHFYDYACRPIHKDIVDKMTIRPAFMDRSQIIYILNNLEYDSSQLKQYQLGYYYRAKDGKVDEIDFEVISELIRYYINCHLDSHPRYCYYENSQYQTVSLEIQLDTKQVIEIIGNNLIDQLEKTRLIDDLYKLNQGEITSMPKTKKLKKEGLK